MLETRFKISISSHIDWFLLSPNNISSLRITIDLFKKSGLGEGSKLLDAKNGDVVEFSFVDFLDDVEVELALAEDNLLDFSVALGGNGIGDDGLEGSFGEVGERACAFLETALGEEDEGGTTEVAGGEATEKVEVGLRSGGNDDLDVVGPVLSGFFVLGEVGSAFIFGDELQEAF